MRLQPLTGSQGLLTMTTLTCLATAVACSSGGAPELSGLTDQVAQVGTELKIDLERHRPGRRPADLRLPGGGPRPTSATAAQITVSPSGAGVFRWTPLAPGRRRARVRLHGLRWRQRHDRHDQHRREVGDRLGDRPDLPPAARQRHDDRPAAKKCVDLDVVIEDQDTAQVTLALEEPMIEGATLDQQDGLDGDVQLVPDQGAGGGEPLHRHDRPPTTATTRRRSRTTSIVLRGGSAARTAPGAAPVIAHTAAERDHDRRPHDRRDRHRRQGPQGGAAVLLLADQPRRDAEPRPGRHDPAVDDQDQRHRRPTALYAADVPNPVAGDARGHDEDALLRVRRRRR